MMRKKLIVNADDFGQSRGINKGIIKAHEQGIVTSASLMVRYPSATEAAGYAKNNSKLGVGLHIDLGEWIYRNENWEVLYQVVPMDDLQAVENEIEKQLQSFFKLMGRKPTHIDSHQHVHQGEAIRPVFFKVAKELNITLRGCSEKVNYCGDFYGQGENGSPYHYAISVDGLLDTITSKLHNGITELACHPGLDDDIETLYRIEREKEVDTLCDKSIKAAIKNLNIELSSFKGITFDNATKNRF